MVRTRSCKTSGGLEHQSRILLEFDQANENELAYLCQGLYAARHWWLLFRH